MFYLRGLGFSALQQYDVEPAGSTAEMMPRQKQGRQLNQFLLLAMMHRLDRSPEFPGPTRFHFDKDEDPSVFRDQVKLPHRGSEISGDNAIAFAA